MKNREKFAKEILDVACKGLEFAVTKSSKITYCSQISCKKCIFKSPKDSEKTCRIKRYEWSESEYVKKPKYTITSKEKMFFDLISAKWKYIVRDNNGVLYAIDSLPIKKYDGWRIENMSMCDYYYISNNLFGNMFDFIKWEDEEPWSIEDLKKLEVKDE